MLSQENCSGDCTMIAAQTQNGGRFRSVPRFHLPVDFYFFFAAFFAGFFAAFVAAFFVAICLFSLLIRHRCCNTLHCS
jgi:hypothetical protein